MSYSRKFKNKTINMIRQDSLHSDITLNGIRRLIHKGTEF